MKGRSAIQAVTRAFAPRSLPIPMKFEETQRLELKKFEEQISATKEGFAFGHPDWKVPLQQQLNKSFSLHLGADIRLPCKEESYITPPPLAEEATGLTLEQSRPAPNPFEGLFLADFAERLGGRIAPVYHEFKKLEKDAAREVKVAAEEANAWSVPIPHFLPFTKMATQHPEFRKTFVFDVKDRKTARLSWYHPDDTMVPRDWLRGGLLEDIKYYFGK